jgi:hypothetical protein
MMAPLLPGRRRRKPPLPCARFALDDKYVGPWFLSILALVLDKRRTCLAFHEQSVAVFANGLLDPGINPDLRLQANGSHVGHQASGTIACPRISILDGGLVLRWLNFGLRQV